MTDNGIDFKGTVEAIIFASGEPLDRLRMIDVLNCTPERLDSVLNEIKNEYDDRGSAVQLLLLGPKVQFATRSQYATAIRNVLDLKRNQPLSSAAFEVLAIIAYNQPVTKSFVEQIRGVDCGGVINTLCQRNLIEECGRMDLPGRPLLYCTTAEFLRCFCMSTLAELPEVTDQQTAAEVLASIQNTSDNEIDGQMSIFNKEGSA